MLIDRDSLLAQLRKLEKAQAQLEARRKRDLAQWSADDRRSLTALEYKILALRQRLGLDTLPQGFEWDYNIVRY